MSNPISRVLSWTAIYLSRALPLRLLRHYQSRAGRPFALEPNMLQNTPLYLVLHRMGFT